jgi:hypothetical protein
MISRTLALVMAVGYNDLKGSLLSATILSQSDICSQLNQTGANNK